MTGDNSLSALGEHCPRAESASLVESDRLELLVRTGQISMEINDCFEQIHGVEIQRREYSSNDQLLEILEEQSVQFDVIQVTDHVVERLIREGRVQKLDRSRIIQFESLDPNYLNLSFDPGNAYTIPFQSGTYALIVNTGRVPGPPTAWADLWNEEYGGRMVLPEDSRAVIGAVLLSMGYDVNTQNTSELERARLRLLDLIPKVRVFDSDNPKTALIAGDVELGITWTAQAQAAHAADPAIQYVYPSEGAILWQDSWAILAGEARSDVAYAWLNYTLQAEVASRLLSAAPSTMPNRAALDYMRTEEPASYELYVDSPITNTALEVLAGAHRLADVGQATETYDRIWRDATRPE